MQIGPAERTLCQLLRMRGTARRCQQRKPFLQVCKIPHFRLQAQKQISLHFTWLSIQIVPGLRLNLQQNLRGIWNLLLQDQPQQRRLAP